MVKRISLALALLASATSLVQAQSAEVEDAASNTAPDFVLKSTAGPNLRLSEYRGEVAMLVFWASWCGECRTQLQQFEELHQAYGESGLELLSINLDPSLAQAGETAGALNLSFPVLHDARGEVAESYDVDDLPLVVFVDREGTLRELIEGYSRANQDIYIENLRNLLRE